MVRDPCSDCGGDGSVERDRHVTVTFPAGIDEGQRLRVAGKGMPGPDDSPPGDLYVDVEIERHPDFERNDNDLITKRVLSFPDAALGTELTITLPDGSEETVQVKAGAQPGSVLSVRAKGMPVINGGGRGALHVVLDVAVPKKLSRRAKKLLAELEAELN